MSGFSTNILKAVATGSLVGCQHPQPAVVSIFELPGSHEIDMLYQRATQRAVDGDMRLYFNFSY